jgi:YVTN family beta-propeller protein
MDWAYRKRELKVLLALLALLALGLGGCTTGSTHPSPVDASSRGRGGGHGDGSAGPSGGEAGLREEAWVSNSGETTISVIDDQTRAVVDTIQLGVADGGALKGIPHGIAVARVGNVAYAGTEDTGEVIALDTRTHSISWRLHAGSNFQLGTLSADDRYLFLPDLLAGRVVVVDTQQRKVSREIPMVDPADAVGPLNGLHNMYTSDDGKDVFVTAIFSQRVARIGADTQQVDRIYSIDGQPRPAALTRNLSTMFLQLSSLQGFIAVDLASGKETARVTIPDDGNRPPGWDNWTFSHGLYLTKDESELWTDSVVAGKVYVYSLPSLDQIAAIDVGIMPRWFAATDDETTLYVTNTTPASAHGTVSVIDRVTRKVLTTLDVGKAPKDVHMVRVPPSRQ